MNNETLDKYFSEIKDNIEKGISAKEITVRELLNILDVSRRGSHVNSFINELLEKHELIIEPSFEWEYVDNKVQIKSPKDASIIFENLIDYRINVLKSANTPPIIVKPDEELCRAITIMKANNFSQLPVITNKRSVKGVITWKSIAEEIFIQERNGKVRDYMIKAVVVDDDSSMFAAIDKIKEHDYVLVRSSRDQIIKGIVTSSDLSEQFGSFSEPFLLIGKCEILIRKLIYGKFSKEELESSKNQTDEGRRISCVHDLTFGEYIKLLECREKWAKLNTRLDRKYFIEKIKKIRDIRNDVMHFDPNLPNLDQIKEIRSFNRLVEYALRRKSPCNDANAADAKIRAAD